ncbi:MAG: hypothetical protein CMK24_09335 [Porticoccaceae bacterium]|jgi:hypothetical protein|nr:hypothetical protein [Porticoccaceae bacterium]|tara:strand:- start:4889 stop:5284 length:396 start_codon:yes stop_codon:yes gene_type:complete
MNNLSILSNTLRIFGLAFIFIIPIMKLDLFGGWAWSPAQWEYELMIQGIYMTLGIMMIISAKNPVKNSMFIWFVVWSSVVHAVIMAYQAAIAADEMGHFVGDIPVLIILALLLGFSLKKAEDGIDLDTQTN